MACFLLFIIKSGIYILCFAGPKRLRKKMTSEQNLGRIFFIQPNLPKNLGRIFTWDRKYFCCVREYIPLWQSEIIYRGEEKKSKRKSWHRGGGHFLPNFGWRQLWTVPKPTNQTSVSNNVLQVMQMHHLPLNWYICTYSTKMYYTIEILTTLTHFFQRAVTI